jgi:hypothetical protein
MPPIMKNLDSEMRICMNYATLICFMLLFGHCQSQNPLSVDIDAAKKINYEDEISVFFKNNSNKPLWFTTKIEKYRKGEWKEESFKIRGENPERYVPITDIKMQLSINDSVSYTYNMKFLDSDSMSGEKKFRIRVDYGTDSDLGHKLYSETFYVTK